MKLEERILQIIKDYICGEDWYEEINMVSEDKRRLAKAIAEDIAKSLPEERKIEKGESFTSTFVQDLHQQRIDGANQMLAEVKAKLGLEDNGCSFCGEYKASCLCSK